MGYIANYGYSDGSEVYYISIDTGKCDGCGECVKVCPGNVFEIFFDDYEQLVAGVREEVRKNSKICLRTL